jgi:endoglucanase
MSSARTICFQPHLAAGLLFASLLVALLSGCGAAQAPPTNPLAQDIFFVNRDTPAAHQVQAWRAAGRTADADQINKIARQPLATWLSGDPRHVEEQVRNLTNQARAIHQTPVLVAYNIPHRDCGNYSAGGAPDSATYTAWISNLARGLNSNAVVILEPDAIPHALTGCLDGHQRDQRYQLLRAAVHTLIGHGARVYLDAGHDGWITDTATLTDALHQSGIDTATGFALNVSSFDTTTKTISYGLDLSNQLGGSHFVIDTSRNGAGPVTTNTDGAPTWCNPPGRALGTPPTTHTGQTRVDAYLWIKNPGDSDGTCHPSAPPAGQWWPDYALNLARHTR